MRNIDTSWIDKLAYKGCTTDADRAARDDMIDKGFTFLQDEKTPFDEQPQPEEKSSGNASDVPPDMAGLWKLAQDFQRRNTPPRDAAEYWDALMYDMISTAEKGNNEPFLMDMITTIYEDLERQAGRPSSSSNL